MGAPSLSKQGAVKDVNSSVEFPADNDFMRVPYNAAFSTPNLTAEAWVRMSQTSGSNQWAVTRSYAFSLGVRSGMPIAKLYLTGPEIITLSGTDMINDGSWHHLAVTYDGMEAKLYLDGEPTGTSVTYQGNIDTSASTDLRVNLDESPYAAFPITIDEVAVYDHALTEAQFAERFSHRWAPKPLCEGSTDYMEAVCNDQPRGYWRLGETSGTTATDVAELSQGALGTVSLNRDGAIDADSDKAIAPIAGATGYVSVPYEKYGTYAAMKRFTAEAWVRANDMGSGYTRTIVDAGGNELAMKSGVARAQLRILQGGTNSLKLITGTTKIYDGAWHHLAVTYDGENINLYVDGESDAAPILFSGTLHYAIGGPVKIGGAGTSNTHFPGEVDEVAIYDHPLDEEALQERFTHRWTPTPECDPTTDYTEVICASDPTGYWRLGESAGATVATDFTMLSNGVIPASGVGLGKAGAILGDSDTAIGVTNSTGYPRIPYEKYGTYEEMEKLTLEAWVRPTTSGSGYTRIAAAIGSNELAMRNGKARTTLSIVNGTSFQSYTITGTSTISDGLWHHLAVTFDGTEIKLYVDGVSDAAAIPAVGELNYGISNELRIGASGAGNSWFPGDVDEIAIYDHALPQHVLGDRFAFRNP